MSAGAGARKRLIAVSDCASKTDIVRPWQSYRPDTAPTPSGFAEIVSKDFPVLHLELCSCHCVLFKTSPNDSEQHAGNDSNPSQEGFMEIKLTYHHRLCLAGRVFPL